MTKRDWGDPAKDNLEIQETKIPITHHKRILLKSPTLEMISEAAKKLKSAGAPKHARISFVQWNIPKTSFYLLATWEDV